MLVMSLMFSKKEVTIKCLVKNKTCEEMGETSIFANG